MLKKCVSYILNKKYMKDQKYIKKYINISKMYILFINFNAVLLNTKN